MDCGEIPSQAVPPVAGENGERGCLRIDSETERTDQEIDDQNSHVPEPCNTWLAGESRVARERFRQQSNRLTLERSRSHISCAPYLRAAVLSHKSVAAQRLQLCKYSLSQRKVRRTNRRRFTIQPRIKNLPRMGCQSISAAIDSIQNSFHHEHQKLHKLTRLTRLTQASDNDLETVRGTLSSTHSRYRSAATDFLSGLFRQKEPQYSWRFKGELRCPFDPSLEYVKEISESPSCLSPVGSQSLSRQAASPLRRPPPPLRSACLVVRNEIPAEFRI